MTHSIVFLGNNDEIIYVCENLPIMMPHDVQNGIGCHLERCTAMNPVQYQRNIEVVFIFPFYTKNQFFANIAVPWTPLMLSRV